MTVAPNNSLVVTYIGGPTALLEFGAARLLTDPTFDPPGGEYATPATTLRKLAGPALTPDQVGRLDYVLLSHDHHFDNLDHLGRKVLRSAKTVFTTEEGAARLGENSVGLHPWRGVNLPASQPPSLRVVGAPARHGPQGMSRGAVTGFILFFDDAADQCIYVSGDTVWYEGVAEVARRFPIRAAILNLGAARVPEVGPFHLTMTAAEAVEAARAFTGAAIIPLHFEGWAHFTEGRDAIANAFAAEGMTDRLHWVEAGRPIQIGLE